MESSRPRGRPRWDPSAEDLTRIQVMASLGMPVDKIALVYGVSEKTLRRAARTQLDIAAPAANTTVGRFLFDAACGKEPYVKKNPDGTETTATRVIGVTGPTIAAAIFWMKTRARWRETAEVELTGRDGEPLAPGLVVVLPSNGRDGEE